MVKSRSIYQVGYRAERKARSILKGWGFTVVRSAKSGGPFDLVAFDNTKFMLVQVKVCPKGKVLPFGKLRKQLAEIPAPVNCRKELWVYESGDGFHYMPI